MSPSFFTAFVALLLGSSETLLLLLKERSFCLGFSEMIDISKDVGGPGVFLALDLAGTLTVALSSSLFTEVTLGEGEGKAGMMGGGLVLKTLLVISL